jgi:hypothetical protein
VGPDGRQIVHGRLYRQTKRRAPQYRHVVLAGDVRQRLLFHVHKAHVGDASQAPTPDPHEAAGSAVVVSQQCHVTAARRQRGRRGLERFRQYLCAAGNEQVVVIVVPERDVVEQTPRPAVLEGVALYPEADELICEGGGAGAARLGRGIHAVHEHLQLQPPSARHARQVCRVFNPVSQE